MNKERIVRTLLFIMAIAIVELIFRSQFWRFPIGNSHIPEKTILVLQSKGYTCGPASLAMVLRAWGIDAQEEEIAKLAGTMESIGTSMYGLKKAAETFGLEMVGMRLNLRMLKLVNKPCIVYYKHHNVVVYGFKEDKAHIADPASGEVWMKTDRFLQLWRGYALIPYKRKQQVPKY